MKKQRVLKGHNDEISLPFHVTIRTVYGNGASEILTNRLKINFVNGCQVVVSRNNVLLSYGKQSIYLEKFQFGILVKENPTLGKNFIEEDFERE